MDGGQDERALSSFALVQLLFIQHGLSSVLCVVMYFCVQATCVCLGGIMALNVPVSPEERSPRLTVNLLSLDKGTKISASAKSPKEAVERKTTQ